MKTKHLATIVLVLGLLLLVAAAFGSAHDTSCENPLKWIGYIFYGGLILVEVGLLAFFRSVKFSWIKAIACSVLLTLVIGVVGFVLITTLQPGGIFHCFQF